MRAQAIVVRLSSRREVCHKVRTNLLCRIRRHEVRRFLRPIGREERQEDTIDVKLVRVADHLGKKQLSLIVRWRNFLLVVVFYRKAHNVRIRRCEPLQKVHFLCEHLQPEFGMIL